MIFAFHINTSLLAMNSSPAAKHLNQLNPSTRVSPARACKLVPTSSADCNNDMFTSLLTLGNNHGQPSLCYARSGDPPHWDALPEVCRARESCRRLGAVSVPCDLRRSGGRRA
jgi:hypothetical protein